MSVGLSFNFSHPIVRLVERDVGLIPVAAYSHGPGYILDLYFHSSDINRLHGALSQYDLIEKDDWLVVRLRDAETSDTAPISRKFLSLTSSLLTAFYVRHDRLYCWVRFHRSELGEVSEVLGKILSETRGVQLEELGSSPGTSYYLDLIHSRIPLAMVSYRYFRPGGVADVGFPDHYTEANVNDLGDKNFRVVAYSEGGQDFGPDVIQVAGNDGIYTYNVFSPLQLELLNTLVERRIPVAASLFKAISRSAIAYQFIPQVTLQEFLGVLYSIGEKHPEAKLQVTGLQNYSREVWELI